MRQQDSNPMPEEHGQKQGTQGCDDRYNAPLIVGCDRSAYGVPTPSYPEQCDCCHGDGRHPYRARRIDPSRLPEMAMQRQNHTARHSAGRAGQAGQVMEGALRANRLPQQENLAVIGAEQESHQAELQQHKPGDNGRSASRSGQKRVHAFMIT